MKFERGAIALGAFMGGLLDGVQPVTVADGNANEAKLPAGNIAGE